MYVLLRHGNLTPDIKYYYRNTYYCQLIQLRYFFKRLYLEKAVQK